MTTYSPTNPVWIDYLILIFPESLVPSAGWMKSHFNKFNSDIDIDFNTFAPRLSADGQEPATHYIIGVLVDSDMKTGAQAQYDAAPNPIKNQIGLYWESEGWTVETAKADQGLQDVDFGLV